MAKNRILYGLLTAVCLVFSMAYRSNFSAVLFITVLLYLPVAAIITAASLLLAKVNFACGSYIGERDMGFEIEVEVRNRFFMPFFPLEILGVLPESDKGVFEERRIFVTLQPFGKTTLSISCRHKYRGKYKAEIKRIYVVDPLGILRFSRKLHKETEMLFLPRRFSAENLFEHSYGKTDNLQSSSHSADREDFSHVRDYRSGDILQLVHWKLTAKSDSVMIKEYEGASGKRAKILCDFESCKYKSDRLLCSDAVIETALAFSKTLLEAGFETAVDYGGILKNSVIFAANPAEYENLYGFMSTLPADFPPRGIDSITGSVQKGEQSVVILITATLDKHTASCANALSSFGEVILAYINLDDIMVERGFYDEKFKLLNIRDTGRDALKKSSEM